MPVYTFKLGEVIEFFFENMTMYIDILEDPVVASELIIKDLCTARGYIVKKSHSPRQLIFMKQQLETERRLLEDIIFDYSECIIDISMSRKI